MLCRDAFILLLLMRGTAKAVGKWQGESGLVI